MDISSLSGSVMTAMQPPKEPPSASDMASMTVDKKDSDGDGYLSEEELGISSDTFTAMDSDGDGLVSSNELSSKIAEKLEMVTEEGEEPDMEAIKSALSELGVAEPEGPPPGEGGVTGTDFLGQQLDQMDLTDEEKEEAMGLMSASTIDMEA